MNLRRPAAVLLATAVLVAGVSTTLAPAAQADAAPSVSAVVFSTTSVNTTDAARTVTVRLRLQDADGIDFAFLETENADRATLPAEFEWNASTGDAIRPSDLTRVSGTAADGGYEIQLVVPRSTRGRLDIRVRARDLLGNDTYWSTAALQALGQPTRFTATSTLPVPKVSNLKGSSVRRYGTVGGIPTTWRNGVLTYTLTGFATGILITSQSGCSTSGGLYNLYEADGEIEFGGRGYGLCRLTLRPVNGSGYGASVSLTFL